MSKEKWIQNTVRDVLENKKKTDIQNYKKDY